jgi:TonB family protein
MIRFFTFSTVLHIFFFASIALSSRGTFKSAPKIEVIKVTIAPMPQPKVFGTPTAAEEPAAEKKAVNKKTEEKSVPKEKSTAVKEIPAAEKKPAEAKPAEKKGLPDGLPDIKPQIYTGSGRGFSYSYYLNILLAKIGKNWSNPYRGQNVVLKNTVYFEVDKNGNISNIRIEDDSGDEAYNETTLRAVSATEKLPPLPQEFANDFLKVHLEFLTAP